MESFQNLLYDEQLIRLGQIVDKLLPHYGLMPLERTLLQYENNAVYRIISESGEQFVARVANAFGRSEQEQRSEMQWLEALRRETTLVVPEPVRNFAGELVTMISFDESTETHPCVVFRWIPGHSPEPALAPAIMQRIGIATAQMHRHPERFKPQSSFVRPRWDGERLFGTHSILHNESSLPLTTQQRAIIQAAGEQISQALSRPATEALSQGLIHADLHRDNILVHHSEIGIIDFDDCGFGYHLYDIASVLDSFQRRVFVNPAAYAEGREALLRGYSRIRPLPPDLDQYLGIFMALRDMVTIDFILRSKNPNVQAWGQPRLVVLIDSLRSHLNGEPITPLVG